MPQRADSFIYISTVLIHAQEAVFQSSLTLSCNTSTGNRWTWALGISQPRGATSAGNNQVVLIPVAYIPHEAIGAP